MPATRADIHAVTLLSEPVRGALYQLVAHADHAVSRDEAAAAVNVGRALAAFHLDRLVAEGMLVAEYRRLSGRTGPGAGRPAKLYRRGARDVVVSLPERRYEIPAQLFADTIEQLDVDLPPDALRTSARTMGEWVGDAARKRAGRRPSQKRLREALLETLAERGYQPHEASGEIRLGNCPFHALVDDHRQLVCGMNLALADGLIAGLGSRNLAARLDPQPGQCCVAIGRPGRA
ncbi:MAG: transcriptional regulator [Chloroflexota bacterium]|nr:transcriptional regulator [Chloroflexota bacterium]